MVELTNWIIVFWWSTEAEVSYYVVINQMKALCGWGGYEKQEYRDRSQSLGCYENSLLLAVTHYMVSAGLFSSLLLQASLLSDISVLTKVNLLNAIMLKRPETSDSWYNLMTQSCTKLWNRKEITVGRRPRALVSKIAFLIRNHKSSISTCFCWSLPVPDRSHQGALPAL